MNRVLKVRYLTNETIRIRSIFFVIVVSEAVIVLVARLFPSTSTRPSPCGRDARTPFWERRKVIPRVWISETLMVTIQEKTDHAHEHDHDGLVLEETLRVPTKRFTTGAFFRDRGQRSGDRDRLFPALSRHPSLHMQDACATTGTADAHIGV